jgi:hypothetical protein
METEIMENKSNTTSILEQEIPIDGTSKPILQVLEERISKETLESLNSSKYISKYENPSSVQAQIEVSKYIKANRPEGELQFEELKNIIEKEKMDEEKVTGDIDFQTYEMLQRGESSEIPKDILSKIRSAFARANQELNKKLKESITAKDLFNMLYIELSNKKRVDYQDLVWQLN